MLFISGFHHELLQVPVNLISFNLVIEMLFISGYADTGCGLETRLRFQSRNRDAFHFRVNAMLTMNISALSFNLVIEMLFISGRRVCQWALL